MTSLYASLGKIQSDVLLITGSLDKKYCTIAQEVSDLNTNISHLIIDEVSHNVHFGNEDMFCETVNKYLK